MDHSLPTDFVSRLERQFPDHAAQIIEAMHGVPRTAINYNTQKPTNQRIGKPLTWNPHGRFVDAEKQFALDPLWHAGAYYVMEPGSQSLASMLSLLSMEEGAWRVLDLCAAPGGKTTVILNHLNDQSLLVSNEIHRQRSQILLENSIKWGRSNHLVSNASPDDLTNSGASFDLIVIDAPCGGEGMFRKDHNARAEWSEDNVAMCAARQEDILDAAKQLLAPDGVIIYSTCTLASAENDNQLKRLLDSGEFELLEGWDQLSFAEAGALQTECGWQFAPGLTESEGLFISAIQLKKGGKQERPAKERYQRWKGENTWFDHLDSSHVFDVKGNPRFIEEDVLLTLEQLQGAKIPVLKAGIGLARAKGKHLVPDHELAMWSQQQKEAIELDETAALDYLRAQSGRAAYPKGWQLVSFEGMNLGWMKSVGDRWNNHYPEKWKLRLR
ncbi:methyltransferase RsmF C-terminal domain-like protein [Sanyastnella coralliicola]|uniref:methyltransferase RsmF C-terminal domain-like protein n=1 Tax=Sanyastnella coralliicola TaxID=3069118 RepID=UPI0027B8FF69|nr:hypothetical protein [Longitalea sp. SCSIO 12813]